MSNDIDDYYRDKTKRTAETVELLLVWTIIVTACVLMWFVGLRAFG